MKLLENILRFERHLEGAKNLIKKDVSDYLVYNTLAMECFQAVNALIEIGEYVVTDKRLGFPSTYREIFELLAREKLMNKDELNAAKRLVFLRDLIAHEYQRITEEELIEMAGLLGIAKGFVDRIRKS